MRPFGVVNGYDSWLRSQVVSNKANFHILLGSMQVYRSALYGIEDYSPLQHRAHAISEFRKQLSTATDIDVGAIFFTMAIFAVFDDTIGDDQAFEVHRKQLCRLVGEKGGHETSLLSVNTAAVQHRFGIEYTHQARPQMQMPSLQWHLSPPGS